MPRQTDRVAANERTLHGRNGDVSPCTIIRCCRSDLSTALVDRSALAIDGLRAAVLASPQDYDERVLPSIGNEVLKAIVAQYNADQLLTMREKV